MFDERLEHLLQIQHARLSVDQRDAVDPIHPLQLRLAIEVVEDDLTGLTAPQLDDHAQAILVGLVAQLGDAFDLLLFHQFGDALDQPRFVQLIGDLGDDDRVFIGLFVGFDLGTRTHEDAAAAGLVRFDDTGATVDDARRREIRPLDVFHQAVDRDLGIIDQREAAIDHFAQVVRRNVRGHTHRDTR